MGPGLPSVNLEKCRRIHGRRPAAVTFTDTQSTVEQGKGKANTKTGRKRKRAPDAGDVDGKLSVYMYLLHTRVKLYGAHFIEHNTYTNSFCPSTKYGILFV